MHLFLIVIWTVLATVLRFTNLSTKALWADEFSTLIFSLGNGYLTIPLDQVLSLGQLLQPLQPNAQASVGTVVQTLLTESNHPPLYFVLSHFWLTLFPTQNGLVSLGAARALSALVGVVTVPASFYLGWLTFQSKWVGHWAALLMALSPFGIYLAQEARHYTLATLWIVASLCCFVAVLRCFERGRLIPVWLCLVWIGVNGLGFATHYFVLFTLVAEAIALLGLWLLPRLAGTRFKAIAEVASRLELAWNRNRQRLLGAVLGTIATVVVWLPILQRIHGTELTRWLQAGEFDRSSWLDQILRLVAGLITMLYLLPIQGVPVPVLFASGAIALVLLGLTVPWLVRGLTRQWQHAENQVTMLALVGFVLAAIVLYLVLTFVGGVNIASVFRYQFFYFPGVMVLLGAALTALGAGSVQWFSGLKQPRLEGRYAVGLVLLGCLVGGLTVVTDLGYQKTHRPDRVAAQINATFHAPTLVAITHKTHGQTGRLMGIAWELQRLNPAAAAQTQFLLAHYEGNDPIPAIADLQQALTQLPRPLDVWRVNFRSAANPLSHAVLTEQGCLPLSNLMSDDGYRYQQYRCNALP